MSNLVFLTKGMVELFCKSLPGNLDNKITQVAALYLANRAYTEEELVDATVNLLVKYQEDFPELEELADVEIIKSGWKTVKELLLKANKNPVSPNRM